MSEVSDENGRRVVEIIVLIASVGYTMTKNRVHFDGSQLWTQDIFSSKKTSILHE